MRVLEVILPTGVDNFTSERQCEAGFVIHVLSLEGEVRDEHLGLTNLSQ